jgi:hypothetical protein
LGNKLLELNALLRSWLSKPDILCFSEHWLHKDQILHINIEHYKLPDSFCKDNNKHWGSCIFVLNIEHYKLPDNFCKDNNKHWGSCKIIVISIHRSPHSNV